MHNMKFTKADKNMPMPAVYDSEYPWGLTVTLDAAALKKLGVDELPDAGEECEIHAHGKVTCVSQSADNENNRSVEIQITHLMLVEKDTDDELWGKAKKDRKEQY
jgi:hypothetical protein